MQELDHARPRVPGVEPAEAAQLVDEGAVIPDVRDSDEFSQGRARGAFQIPCGALGERLGPRCRSCARSSWCAARGRSYQAAQTLGTRGYSSMSLAGGMHARCDDWLPVERGDGSPGVVA